MATAAVYDRLQGLKSPERFNSGVETPRKWLWPDNDNSNNHYRSFIMQLKSSVFASSLAAVVATVALQAPVFAAPATPESAPVGTETQRGYKHEGKHHGKRHGEHQGARAALVVPGYGGVSQELLDTLALTDAQKGLIEQAQQARKSLWSGQNDEMKSQREARKAQLLTGKIDPRAAVEAHQARRAKMMQAQTDMTAKWLAVWDALDDTQRGKIAAHLAERGDSTGRR